MRWFRTNERQHRRLRHREDRLAAALERPDRHQLGVGLAGQRRARGGDVPVERRQQLGLRRERGRRLSAGEIDFRFVQRLGAPRRKGRHVRRQRAERERLRVRLPVELVFGHALEQLPRGRHLVIELGQQRIDERHGLVSYDGWRSKSTFGTRSASGGALNTGYSLKPKMLAVMFDGNWRRAVLYSCTRSL